MKGIINQGNTCYLNSALQILYSVEPFRKRMIDYQNPTGVIAPLKEVFTSLASGGTNPASTKPLTDFFETEVDKMEDINVPIDKILSRIDIDLKKEFMFKEGDSNQLTYRLIITKTFDKFSFSRTIEILNLQEYPDYILIDTNSAGLIKKEFYDLSKADKGKEGAAEDYLVHYRFEILENFEIDGNLFELQSFAVRL
jgi:hypothetical protein